MDIRSLEPGHALLDEALVISGDDAAAYRDAVGDDAPLYDTDEVVPTLAVAAAVMGAAMRAVELPAGAIHMGQELTFLQPVKPGASLRCSAAVVQNSLRRGTRLLVLGLNAWLEGGPVPAAVLEGRATIALAEAEDAEEVAGV